MESDNTKINLKDIAIANELWTGVIFINHRITTKVFLNENFELFARRLRFILGIEDKFKIGLKPSPNKEENKK